MKNFVTSILLFAVCNFCICVSAQDFPTQTFDETGTFTFTIPGDSSTAHTILIDCVGADGGPFFLNGFLAQGGTGATLQAEFDVFGGDELTIFVGQSGQLFGNPAGGGGGGGSAVILNSADVLIASGAGGGGGVQQFGLGGRANTNSTPQGGAGPGASGGGGFNSAGEDGVLGSGGGAGTLTVIGAGGIGGVVAGFGGQGFGGGGGGSGTVGGGGGGYQGGAGGNGDDFDVGQGGDSFVNSGFSSNLVSATPGVTGGGEQNDGVVVIASNSPKCELGDINQDGTVDLLDIGPFVDLLTNNTFQCEADVNEDGVVDLLDVAGFVELISGSP